MTDKPTSWWRGLLWFQLFSPKGFLICAATLGILFLACHAAGLREYTSILCGQSRAEDQWAPFLGMGYVLFYLAFVLLVPVLVLAAAILALLQRLLGGREPPAPLSPEGEAT